MLSDQSDQIMEPIGFVPLNGSSLVKGFYQEDIFKRPILTDTQCAHRGQIQDLVEADGDVVLAGLGLDQLFHVDYLSRTILVQLYLATSRGVD